MVGYQMYTDGGGRRAAGEGCYSGFEVALYLSCAVRLPRSGIASDNY
jgi:hypothetical protein